MFDDAARGDRHEVVRSRDSSQKLPQKLRQHLIDYIYAHKLQPGDRLPTEPELSELFGVSRTSLREAMKYLEMLGIVSIEPGRGTYLRSFEIGHLLAHLPIQLVFTEKDLLEVTRIRQILEEDCLEQAMIRGREEGFRALAVCIDAMRGRVEAGESMEAEDMEFHRQIAHLAGAKLSLMIMEVFWRLRKRWPADNSPEALKRRLVRHERIYQAMCLGDLQLARLCLADHFAGSYMEMVEQVIVTEQNKKEK